MKTNVLQLAIILWMIFSSSNSNAQDSSSVTKHIRPKTIWEIPHKTTHEKWMWIHRSMAFQITKERPVNYDTAYIRTFYKRLVVTIPVSTQFLQFSLQDLNSGNKLTFAPNIRYSLGVSISSRWASFIINPGIKLDNANSENKGTTKFHDYQLNLYGRKITTDLFFQSYSGFYIRNSESYDNYVSDKPYSVRSDVSAMHFGVSTYYIFNGKKFSYRNSFAFVEQQKKSAGSLLFGVYYSYLEAKGNPSLVLDPFRSSFDTLSIIKSGRSNTFGLNIGYIFTFVFLKKFYTTASLVQGFGGKQIEYKRDDASEYRQMVGGPGKLNVRFALGYDQGRYFIGAMGIFDYYFFKGKSNSTFDYSYGKFMAYVGYRFSVLKAEKKLLRKLKLIDY